MTKTTSYEISKKLEEAGFKASYIYAWYTDSEGSSWIQEIQHVKPTAINRYGKEVKLTFIAPAYDLETLLDALPESIQYKSSDWYYLFLRAPSRFSETNKTLGYYNECSEYMDNFMMGCEDGIFEVSKLSPNESLADTAGKMWLILKEKGLV